jgi:biotin operon repressor
LGFRKNSVAQLFALLYITGSDWTADELRERLRISRGNVSMNLRELMAWGVVQKVHRQGERREFYRVDESLTSRVKGTGLGLSIVSSLVTVDLHGNYTIDGEPGSLVRVTVTVPAPR